MTRNYRKIKKHKSTLKFNLIFSLICLFVLCISMGINSISKNYNSKISYLTDKINSTKEASMEIRNKNKSLEASIEELNTLIEEVKSNLN